jgi:hypothetical protein
MFVSKWGGVMNDIMTITLRSAGVILAADLTAGLIHWIEDACICEHTPLIGQWIGRPNTFYHHLPRRMKRNSWLHSNWDQLVAVLLILIAAALSGRLE